MRITVRLKNVEHSQYAIVVKKCSIKVILKDADEQYAVDFASDDFSGYHIEIMGSCNTVFVGDALKCASLHADCGAFISEDSFALTAELLSLQVGDAEVGGKVRTTDLNVTFKDPHGSITHYGQVYVDRLYKLAGGSFTNKGTFYVNAVEMIKNTVVLNDVNASWHSQAQVRIQGETFINLGRFSGDITHIQCAILQIKHAFSGTHCELQASTSLQVDANAEVAFSKEFYAVTSDFMSVAGSLTRSGNIRLVAKNMNIAATAKLIECESICMVAYGALKIENKATLAKIGYFNAMSLLLDIEATIHTQKEIKLDGKERHVLHQTASLVSPSIELKGIRIFLHGKTQGQLEFPQHMEHVYLAETSSISNCDHLKIRANLIERLGKLFTFHNDFSAALAVVSDDKSTLYAVTTNMHAAYVSIAGRYAMTKFSNTAVSHLALNDKADLENSETILYAPFVALAGHITGAVDARSDSLVTTAAITNDATTSLHANKILVTEPGSRLDGKDIKMTANEMLHFGKAVASSVLEENGSQIYHDKTSAHAANINNIHGNEVTLGGFIEAGERALISGNQSVHLIRANKMAGVAVKIQSPANIDGVANLECQHADVIGMKRVDLDEGEFAVEEVLTVAGREVHLGTKATANEMRLLQVESEGKQIPAYLSVTDAAELTADKVVENFDKANIAGKVITKTAVLQSKELLTITEAADVTFKDALQIQANKALIDGNIERSADDENKGIMTVEGEEVYFAEASHLASSVPVSVTSSNSVFAGEIEAALLHNQADNTLFANGSVISEKSGDIVTVGKTDKANVEIQQGAMIGGKSFTADQFAQMQVAGQVASQAIKIKGNQLKIQKTGKLGTMETKMMVDVSYLTLFGTIEADEAKLKVARAFVQSGFHGPALLRARKLAIDSVFYINLLGRTYAHSATINSLVSLSLSLELINYKVSNSAIGLGMGLGAFHPSFLIESIKNNNVEFLSPQFLQYTLQSAITLLQPFFPTVTLAANTALSAYFLYVNVSQSVDMINELRKKHELGEDIRLVDTLGLLVGMKNTANAGVSLYNNGTALYDALKDKILDNITDLKDYLGEDLVNDIRDKLTPHPDKEDSEHPSITKDKQNGDQAKTDDKKDKHHKKDKHKEEPKKEEKKTKPAPTTWETWQKWWQELDGYDFAHDNFTKFVVAPLSIFMPSSNEFSLIGGRLGKPMMYFTDIQQGFITASAGSPVVAAVSNKTGWYCLADIDTHLAYTQILNGYHVIAGNSFAHNYSANSHDYTQLSGAKVRAGNLYLKEDEITPHDMKGKHSTFECNKVKDRDDFFRFVGAYDVFKPEDPLHSSANFRLHDSVKFYHSLQFDCATTICGDDIYVEKGVELNAVNGSLGLVATKQSIIVKGELKAKKNVSEDSADDILHDHAKVDAVGHYERARHNIHHTNGSRATCEEGAIVAERGDVTVTGSEVEFKKRGYVKAHNNVKAECTTKNITTHGDPDVAYTPGVIKGGDEEVGLYVEARKIWNIGSYMGAKGGYYLKARALEAVALTNQYTKEHKHHKSCLGMHDSYRDVRTTRVQNAIFAAEEGQGVVKVDHIKTIGAKFESKQATIIDTRDEPEFLDFDVHTDTHKSSSFASIKYKKQHHVEDKKTGESFQAGDLLYVKCRYGNIVFKNCDIKATVLSTEAERGGTFVVWDPATHFKDTSYLSISAGIGPLNYSYSFDPDDKHKHKVTFQDPLVDGAKSLSNSKGIDGKIASGLNTADALLGKMTGPVVPTTVGVSVGWNHRIEHYQATNPDNKLVVDVWHDYSEQGIGLTGVEGVGIGMIDIHRGDLVQNGVRYQYDVTSTSKSIGASYDPVTNRLDAKASITGFKSHNQMVRPCSVSVGRLIFRKEEATITLNDGQLRVHDLHGRVNVTERSTFSDMSQTMTSASLSTGGDFSVAHVKTNAHVHTPSFLEVTDMSNATIHHYDSVGGELRGDGFKDYQPEVVQETKLQDTTKTTGFSVAGNVNNHSVASVGYTNTVNNHGANFTLNTPNNLIRTFSLFAQTPPVTRVVDIPVDDAPVTTEVQSEESNVTNTGRSEDRAKAVQSSKPESTTEAHTQTQSNDDQPQPAPAHESEHDEEHEHLHYLTPHESKHIFGYLREPTESDFRFHGTTTEPAEAFTVGVSSEKANVTTSKTFEGASRYPLFTEEGWSNSYIYQVNKNYSLYDGRISAGDVKGVTEIYRTNYGGNESIVHREPYVENPNYLPRLNFNANRAIYGGMMFGSYLLAGKAIVDDLGSFAHACEVSYQHHTPRPAIYEGSRIGFSWTGALSMGSCSAPIITAGVLALELSNPVTAIMTAGLVLASSNVGGHAGQYASERFLSSAEVAANGFYNAGRQIWSNAKFSYHTLYNAMVPPPPPPPMPSSVLRY